MSWNRDALMIVKQVPLAVVAAVGRNGALGANGKLPWHMPSDLARFRERTMGKPMILGRCTFESIGRALPGRESIVVSRDRALALPRGVFLATTPEAALELATVRAQVLNADEISLIGGGTLFAQMLPQCDRLYMTFVDLAPQADTFFPPIAEDRWRQIQRTVPTKHAQDDAGCIFVDYVRR